MPEDLAAALLDLQRLTERLRRDCAWDREQTAKTIVPHTVEEAYEVADAAFADDPAKLVDELGDLLFQSFFLALLLEERGEGDLAIVARQCHEKLVRRHPHVFGDAVVESASAVRSQWEEIKRTKEEREGIFHEVGETFPALLEARKVQRRAAAVGFEYPDLAGARADLGQEVVELDEVIAEVGEPTSEREPAQRAHEELGDVLFAAVNVARRLNVDPELALRSATSRFRTRVERAAELAAADGKDFGELELAIQDSYFDRAKES